jgi:hypothetical protein
MATVIWCDKIRHIVQESRTEISDGIAAVMYGSVTGECSPPYFLYVTPENSTTQRALNVKLISSYEAMQGDGI